MAVSGKDKVERHLRVWWDHSDTPRDLSGDLLPGTLTGGGKSLDEVEMTGVSDEFKNFLSGHANSEIAGQFYMNDTAVTGATTILKATIGVAGTLTLMFGGGGTPAADDPEWEGEYVLLDASIVLAGNKPVHQCRWLPTGSVAPAWGVYS